MRYFTPERLVRLQDHSDERPFLAALDAWERAVSAYREELNRIQNSLPPRLRRLVSRVSLHDARVLAITQGMRSRLTVILQPESDPARQVVLGYSLVEPPQIIEGALPEAVRSKPLTWLYDELDVEPHGDGTGPRRGRGPKTYSHLILLSNGWEIRLRFRTATVTRPVSLLPTSLDDPMTGVAVSRSA